MSAADFCRPDSLTVADGLTRSVDVDQRAKLRTVLRMPHAIKLEEKFDRIDEHWRPKVVAELNGQEVKLVKFQGVFPWHHHANEDEMFLVWRGRMRIEFRDRTVELGPGELCVVPRGVEHRTAADAEAEVIIFEPAATRNTGNVTDPRFTAPNGVQV